MRLNRLIKSQESFMGVFLILERHLIYYQYLELIVRLQFVECRIELFIFNLIVKWTSDHFDSCSRGFRISLCLSFTILRTRVLGCLK